MQTIGKKTNKSVEDILSKARDFFDDSLGLKTTDEESDCCIEFRSNSGFVNVTVQEAEGKNDVTIRSREHERQARNFLEKL